MAIVTTTQVNSALHPSGVAKSSTSSGWGKSGKVTAAGWQVTLCDPTWHVISRSGVVKFTNCYTLFSLHTWNDVSDSVLGDVFWSKCIEFVNLNVTLTIGHRRQHLNMTRTRVQDHQINSII